MSRAAHLAELERRHRALEREIPRRKLLMKDEIARLQTLIGIAGGASSNFQNKAAVPGGLVTTARTA